MNDAPQDSLLLIELGRHAEDLNEGGVEALHELWRVDVEGLAFDEVAEFVAERMLDDEGPAAMHRRGPQMMARGPLLAALHRRRFELRAWGVDQLNRDWGPELRRMSPAKIAGEVARRLASPEFARFLRTDDPNEKRFDRVYRVIQRFHADLVPTGVLDLARLWGPELRGFEAVSQVVEGVARRLEAPAFAGYLRPGHRPPATGEAALRAALARYPDLVPPASRESLFASWKPLFEHLPPSRVAGLVAEKLGAEN